MEKKITERMYLRKTSTAEPERADLMGKKFTELGFEIELKESENGNGSEYDEKPPTRTTLNQTGKIGKILVTLTGSAALGLTVICIPFVSPAFRKVCLPYVPATNPQLQNIFTALKNYPKTTIVDLGSGDGRIVLEAARQGYKACGIELNPFLVLYSRLKAFTSGLNHHQARFICKDLWKCPLGIYDNIIIFGVPQMMEQLEKKLVKECHGRCNIVVCRFPLPNLIAAQVVGVGIDTVWLYSIPTSSTITSISCSSTTL